MQLPPSTPTSRLSTSATKLIDRAFDHRPIGKEGLNEPLHLVDELNKGLAEPAEFLSVCSMLYAH
jgi:hypothetical protein